MAQVNFNDVQDTINSNDSEYTVSYFSLKNNGDEAIVRINYADVSQFKLMTVHTEKVTNNGRSTQRKINCLRGPKDPINLCPLCESGNSSRTVFYIPMIQYIIDPNTHGVSYKHVIWERSTAYAAKLKTLMEEYGPLTDCIFKIKRVGEAGSRDTTYEIMYGNEKMYPEDVFVKDFEPLNSYKVLGSIVMDKTYEELCEFINTGTFTSNNNNSNIQKEYTPKNDNVPWNENVNNSSFVPTQPQYVSQNNTQSTFNESEYSVRNTPMRTQEQFNVPNSTSAPPQRTTRYY